MDCPLHHLFINKVKCYPDNVEVVSWDLMKAFEIIPYKGKNIAMVDISNTTTEQVLVALVDAQKKISKMPENSVLIMTDGTNAAYNKDTGAAMKEFLAKNTPYIRASAVVGVEGLKAVLQTTVAMTTKREIASFSTRGEAMDWLAAK